MIYQCNMYSTYMHVNRGLLILLRIAEILYMDLRVFDRRQLTSVELSFCCVFCDVMETCAHQL